MNETCSHFTAVCPGCLHGLKVNQKYSGQWVRCRHCDVKFQVVHPEPASPSDSTATEASPSAPMENGPRLTTACPSCATSLSVRAKYAGRHIRCGKCGHKFQVGGKASAPRQDESAEPRESAAFARLVETTAYLAAKSKRMKERQRELRRAFQQLHAEFERLSERDSDVSDSPAFMELRRLHKDLKAELDRLKGRLDADAKTAESNLQAAENRRRHDELAAAVEDLRRRVEGDGRDDRIDQDLGALRRGRDEADARIADLRAQLLGVEEELRTALGSQGESLQAGRADLAAAIDALKARLAVVEADAGSAATESALAGLAAKHEDTAAAIGELKAGLQILKAEAGARTTEQALDGLANRHDAMTRTIEALAARIQGIEADPRPERAEEGLTGLAERHEELTAAIADLKARLRDVEEASRTSTTETALAGLVDRHEAAAAVVEGIKVRLLEIEAEARTPRDDRALAGLDRLQAELASAVEGLQARLQDLETDARPETLARELGELNRSQSALAGRHDELTAALGLLDDRIKALADEDQDDRRDQLVAELQRRHDELWSAIDLLRKDAEDRNAQEGEALEAARRRHDALADRIDHDLGALGRLRDEDAAGLAGRHDELAAALEDVKARLRAFEAAPAPAPATALDPSPMLDELRREIELLKQRPEGQGIATVEGLDDGRFDRLQVRHDELAAAIDALKVQNAPTPSVKEFAALRAQADEAKRELEFLKVRLNRVESVTNRTPKEFTAQIQRNDQFAKQHGEAASAIEALKAQVEAAREELAAIKERTHEAPASIAPAFKSPGLAAITGPASFSFHGRSRPNGR